MFRPGLYPSLHTCSASVVRSKSRDIVLTAAHCMYGDGTGFVFAPGYVDGRTPYGVWHVSAIYGAAQWLHQRKGSTHHDWAFLRVKNEVVDGKVIHLQDVTGGNRLGMTAQPKQKVTVPGYGVGSLDKPISCRAPVYRHAGYPAFDCGGYVGGVSGSAWLIGHGKIRTVVGVIGGLHQGGCAPSTSYSSPLGKSAHAVFHRAERGHRTDTFPDAPSDGC